MAIEKVDVMSEKTFCMPPDDEDDQAGNNNPYMSYMIETLCMGRPNRDLDVSTEWKMFPAPAWYDDEDGGKLDVILGQGPWLDQRALDEGDIVNRNACDRWPHDGIRLE